MNMTMTYDGTMVMPKNYAVVTEDEMTYVDGGYEKEYHLWGIYYTFTHAETKTLINSLIAGAAGCTIGGLYVGTAVFGAYSQIIRNMDEGNGVHIKQFWNGLMLVYTA